MGDKLRLRAADAEDLAILSACLQDARVTLREMVFLATERRFMAAFVRYRRELLSDPTCRDGLTERPSMLTFDGISEVKYRGIDPSSPGFELNLLTIATSPGHEWLVHVDLVFSGDARIQLRTGAIDCRLEDFGEAREAVRPPCDHFAPSGQAGTSGHADNS